MFKRFSLWFCNNLFAGALFLLIITTTLSVVVRPSYIKGWINKSGLYSTLSSSLVKQANEDQSSSDTSSSDQLSFSDPGVQTAAKAALAPDFVKSSTEQFVDSNFKWLDGAVSKPDFSIDLASRKEVFVNSLIDYYKNRYNGLPACAAGQQPTSIDLAKIDCRPQGLDINSLADSLHSSLLDNKDFLANSKLTADNLGGNSSQQKDSPYRTGSPIPKAYKALRFVPITLFVVCLLAATGIIFLSESKRIGTRKVGWRMVTSGGLSLILLIVGYIGITKLALILDRQVGKNTNTVFNAYLADGLRAVRVDVSKVGGIVAGLVFVIGLVLLFITRKGRLQKEIKLERGPMPESATPVTAPKPEPPKAAPVPSAPPLPRPRPKRTLIQ